MSDSIGYPLPVIKNGYACLDAGEIELARKNIDPARPKAQPEAAKAEAGDRQPAPAQTAAMRRDAGEARVVGYSTDAIRREVVATGTILSLEA